MFKYYTETLMGVHPFESDKHRERGLLRDWSKHYLMKYFENLKYVVGREVTKHGVLTNLHELGTVSNFGYSPKVNVTISSKYHKDDLSIRPITFWREKYYQE